MRSATTVRTTVRVLLAAAVAGLAVGCSDGAREPTITVGAGDSVQSEVLAEIYAQALARTGAHVVTRTHLGQRGDYLAALDAGTITLVGDTSGDLLRTFDSSSTATAPNRRTAEEIAQRATGPDPESIPDGPAMVDAQSPRSVADDLSRAVPQGLVISDIADAADLRPQLALGPAAAKRFPANLTELAPECDRLSVGIATGHELDPLRPAPDPRRDVLEPLHTVYGCNIVRHTEFDGDRELRQAMRAGTVDAGVFTAPVSLLPGGGDDLAVVADPDCAFRAQNVIPLLRRGVVDRQRLKKLNHVAGELTTAEFTGMIRRVRDDHAVAADVARTWLDEHAL